MPTPSKFTQATRAEIVKQLRAGSSRRTASHLARISEATLRNWMERGRTAPEGSAYAQFREDVLAAEAEPNVHALHVVRNAWADRPDLAWKWLERREDGFAPPMPHATPAAIGPVIIQLALHDGTAVTDIIEGEVIDAEDVTAPALGGPAS